MYRSEVADHRQDYRGQAVSTFNIVWFRFINGTPSELDGEYGLW
jgi:hypothetical protein